MHLHNTFRNVHRSRACTNLGPHPHTVKSEKRSVAEQLISVTQVLRAGTLPHICLDHGPRILKNLCCQVAVRNVRQQFKHPEAKLCRLSPVLSSYLLMQYYQIL